MNIFQRLIYRQNDEETRLGNPLDAAGTERRLNNMASRTGGRGFRVPPAPKDKRRDAKRAAREIYLRRLDAEATFRAAKQDMPGYGIAEIRDAIERGEHLKEQHHG